MLTLLSFVRTPFITSLQEDPTYFTVTMVTLATVGTSPTCVLIHRALGQPVSAAIHPNGSVAMR